MVLSTRRCAFFSLHRCDFASSSPVGLWDHALYRRVWTAKSSARARFAVDGDNGTSATTGVAKYPFLAVDLGTALDVDFMILNIKQGKIN